MQNIVYRQPGLYVGYNYRPDGSLFATNNTLSSAAKIVRSQSGYTGARPKTKPMPVHAYGLTASELRLTQVYYSSRDTAGWRSESSGPCLSTVSNSGFVVPSFDNWAGVDARALSAFTEKVRGGLDLSIDLAEAGKTIKMFNTVEKAIDYTKVFKRKYGLIKTAANAWLEYTYGWKPLAQAIYGAADESLRLVLNRLEHVSGRASEHWHPKYLSIEPVWGGSTNFDVSGGSLKSSVTYGCCLTTSSGFDMSRWTSMNPASIAWELLPFSFVVDWVYNVGGYLRNLETAALYASRFHSGYRTALTVGNIGINHVRSTTGPGIAYERQAYMGSLRLVQISRTVLSSYPSPGLPSFDVRLGSSRLISAAALLGQLL